MVIGWATMEDAQASIVQYTCSDCAQLSATGTSRHYYLPWIPIYKSPQIHCTYFLSTQPRLQLR